jgi:hypothetical protein
MSNPFDPGYNQKRRFGKAVTPMSLDEKRKDLTSPYDGETIKQFPLHQFTPLGAKSVDIRNAASITNGSTFQLLRWQIPTGMQVFFTGYSIFNDALLFNTVEFIPRVNGSRILPFHGYPQTDGSFKIALGLGPSLDNASLIECQLQLNPGDILTWDAINNAGVDVVMGVRMKGYAAAGNIRTNGVFGG